MTIRGKRVRPRSTKNKVPRKELRLKLKSAKEELTLQKKNPKKQKLCKHRETKINERIHDKNRSRNP